MSRSHYREFTGIPTATMNGQSVDTRKTFDSIDHIAPFESLMQRDLYKGYIMFPQSLYRNESGSVGKYSIILIENGVKQDDTLSDFFFNYVMDRAFDVWKWRLQNQGIFIVHDLDRLSNIRYADDIMI